MADIFTCDSIICYSAYMVSSLCHTGGSYKNGWSKDYEIFTIR